MPPTGRGLLRPYTQKQGLSRDLVECVKTKRIQNEGENVQMFDGTRSTNYDITVQSMLDFEDRHNLFEIRINDVRIWEWLRVEVMRAILKENNIISKRPSESKYWYLAYPRSLGRWAKGFFNKNPLFADEAERLYWGHQRRKQLEDGFWWDIYCDPFHVEEDASFVHVEAGSHQVPAKTDGLRYMDFIQYSGAIAEHLPVVGVKLTPTDRRRIQELESMFKDSFGIKLNLSKRIENHLTKRKVMQPLYKRLLDNIQPKVVILVVSYGKESFIEVCKDIGVPVVELQHGAFGPAHPGYAFPGERTKNTFPDYLFTFGNFWRESVEFPIPQKNVIPIGYPHLEKQKRKFKTKSSENRVLFLSQWSIGENLTKFAKKYARLENDREVMLKLHPQEYSTWKEDYPWLRDAPLTVIDGDNPSLYELLASSSVQVGVYSTVIYEGLNFGLDTYLLDLPGVTRMKHLLENRGITLVSSLDQFIRKLNTSNLGEDVDVSYYFEPNPIENFEGVLSRIQLGKMNS